MGHLPRRLDGAGGVGVEGLEVTSVLTKIKGGVDVTLVVQNRGNTPVTVDNASPGRLAGSFT